jgi:hypothetical protein
MLSQDDDWYYAGASGTAEGPVSSAALRALRRAGHVTDDTPVWCDALVDWTRFEDAIGGSVGAPEPPPLPLRLRPAPGEGEDSAGGPGAGVAEADSGVTSRAEAVDQTPRPPRRPLRPIPQVGRHGQATGLGVPRPPETERHGAVGSDDTERAERTAAAASAPGETDLMAARRKRQAGEEEAALTKAGRSGFGYLSIGLGLLGVVVMIDEGLVLASPEYHDRRARQQVLWGMDVAARYQAAVVEALEHGRRPWEINNESLGLPWRPWSAHVGEIDVFGGLIVLRYGRHSVWRIKGKTLTYRAYYARDGSIRWACGYEDAVPGVALVEAVGTPRPGMAGGYETTVESKYLPSACKRRVRVGHVEDDCRGGADLADLPHCRSELQRRAEAAEARRPAEAKAQVEREAVVRAEREATLQRLLATDEEVAAFGRSGVVDEYRQLLVQTFEGNWIRPPSARAGIECTVYVSQTPAGDVEDIRVGSCNGDQAVRESIVDAVLNSAPLPLPSDPRAFQRRLEIVFRPMR